MSDKVLELCDATKDFGAIRALDGVSLSVDAGEVFGFIGPNGSGKTTAIRTMLGFYRLSSGSVRVFGLDPLRQFAAIGPKLGVMLEQPGLNGSLTAREYLAYFGGMFDRSRPEVSARSDELLRAVGLFDRGDHLLKTYSKGMRQRVTLARCLLNRPRLLILDEPFDGIDAETRRDILKLIPEIVRGDGTSVFITSHNLPEVEKVCDRVAILKKGRVLACDRVDDLLGRHGSVPQVVIRLGQAVESDRLSALLDYRSYDPKTLEVTLDTSAHNGKTRDKALKVLVENSISVAEITETHSRLEDVYFSLTEAGERK